MNPLSPEWEFPKDLSKHYRKAISYEWISLFYIISATIFSFLTMSNSQTMKTVWMEDMLGIIPPLSFLISSKIINRKANKNFPYGFHRITSAAYLSSSLALFILGLYLFLDGVHVLLIREHPSIGDFNFLGHSVWFGYLMILALLWSSLPSTVLGHIKLPLAYKLYDKILLADSQMNKASWMSGFASILGIIGIGLGYWWADALVGIIISGDILHDGYIHLKQSLLDLLNQSPKTLKDNKREPLVPEITKLVADELWVKTVTVRFRDEGHVYFGEIFIVPKTKNVSGDKIDNLLVKIRNYHWRFHDVILTIQTAK